MIHTLVAKVENNPGVLSRVAGHFSRRGYNIQNIVTSQTKDSDIVHLTITIEADNRDVELVISQLSRLVEVIEACDIEPNNRIERQTMLIRLICPPVSRQEILRIADIYGGRMVYVGQDNVVVELTEEPGKIDAAMSAFEHYGILDLIRTGSIVMENKK